MITLSYCREQDSGLNYIIQTLFFGGVDLYLIVCVDLSICELVFMIVGTGADPGFNATTTHQQNPNYQSFRQHL